MRKTLATILAVTCVTIMICGCAKQGTQETDVKIVGTTEAASEQNIVINDEKPSETVERVPDQIAETKQVAEEPTQAPTNDKAAETKAPDEVKASETAAAAKEGDLVSNDYSKYAGKYIRTEDGSSLELSKDGKVKISIIRLTEMDGKAEGIYKNIIKITAKDANDGDMKLEFLTDTNELVVTGSTWSLLPNGETFKFDKKE